MTVATLTVGLRDDSRLKMKYAGTKLSFERLMLVKLYDILNWIAWTKTKDAQKGRNMPVPLMKRLMTDKPVDDSVCFSSREAFEAERNRMLKRIGVTRR